MVDRIFEFSLLVLLNISIKHKRRELSFILFQFEYSE